MRLNTTSQLARAQLRANRAFAEAYVPQASPVTSSPRRPRVVVSGFGRFSDKVTNATGLMVGRLLPGLDYPFTEPPVDGEVDVPGPQLAVAQGTVELPAVGDVDLCAVVLPVFWDLAAYLLLREIQAFAPQVVVMNGVAAPRQKLWLELGAFNRGKDSPDGSGILRPTSPMVELIRGGPEALENVASWNAIALASADAIAERASVSYEGKRLDDVLRGVAFAGFPRASNTYVCNNTTYVVGRALDRPGEPIRLLESGDDAVELRFGTRGGTRPPTVSRWFMHWPSALAGPHLDAAADVLRAVLAAQLVELAEGRAPTRGDNALAEIPATP